MKNLYFLIICMLIVVATSSCHKLSALQDAPNATAVSLQQQINNYNDKSWTSAQLAAISSMKLSYESLLDTNKMDPRATEASIAFILKYNQTDNQEMTNQLAFIKTSGFPLIASPEYATALRKSNPFNSNYLSVTSLLLNSMKKDFDTEDSNYKSFVSNNSSNHYISVFKEDAANLIIRKYLLDNTTRINSLKFYVDELIRNKSQDYSLIYLCLDQLKNQLPTSTLNYYKSLINHDSNAIKFRLIMNYQIASFENKAKSYGGRLGDALNSQALILKVPVVTEEHFLNKINSVAKTVNM